MMEDRYIDAFFPNDDVSEFRVGVSLTVKGFEYGRIVQAEQSGAGVLVRFVINSDLMRIVALDPHYGLRSP